MRDELSKINLVVIVSREHWECDSLSPMFLFSQEVFDKNSVAVFGKKVDGVPYMNDIVESVSPSNGGGQGLCLPQEAHTLRWPCAYGRPLGALSMG